MLADGENIFQWRLRIPFNHIDGERNYLSKLMRYERLLDVENSISHLDEFAACCVDSWAQRIPFGIYNITNTDSVTTRQVVEIIKRELKIDKAFEFFASEQEFLQLAAKTPRSNCVLDNAKLRSAGIKISHVEDAIVRSLRQWSTTSSKKTSMVSRGVI